MTPIKRKKEMDDFIVSDSGDDSDTQVKKKKKTKKKTTPKKEPKEIPEPWVDDKGWHFEPPSLIWKEFGATEPSEKIAAFDLDGTLVLTKQGNDFPSNANDWRWWNKKVPATLAGLAEEGYKIVIFSNQGGIKGALGGKMAVKVQERCRQIFDKLLEEQDVPVQVFLAPCTAEDDPCRKPGTGMWDYMVAHCNGGIKPDLAECFFCGDADGVLSTFSDSDKVFAENVGLPFKTPPDVLGQLQGKMNADSQGIKQGKQLLEAGEHPNAHLISEFRRLADEMDERLQAGEGGPNDSFKIRAYKKVADALSGFQQKVSESNLKQVSALSGVGKASLEKIKTYLAKGFIESGVGSPKKSPASGSKAKPGKKAAAAMAFL